MANFSAYLEQALLGVTLLGSSFTEIQTQFLSLATSLNSDGDSYTEVTTGIGYGRLVIEWSGITSGPDYSVVNSSSLTYSPATTPWGTVTHFGIYDNQTIGAGNLLYWGQLTASRAVDTSDVLEFQAGSLYVQLS